MFKKQILFVGRPIWVLAEGEVCHIVTERRKQRFVKSQMPRRSLLLQRPTFFMQKAQEILALQCVVLSHLF
jgi:hypothetical protein